MRFALLALLICFACNTEDVNSGHERIFSLYDTDVKTCESLALKSYNTAFKANNEIAIARLGYLLGIINSRNEKYRVAVDFLNNSIDKFGDNDREVIKCLYALGFVYTKTGNLDLVESVIKQALSLNISNTEQSFDLNYRLAGTMIGLGKKDTAIEIINNVLLKETKEKPFMGQRFSYVGYLYIMSEKYDEAIELLNKSISLDKSNNNIANCYGNLAYAYLKKNDLAQALRLANKSIGYNKDMSMGDVLRTRAFIYIKMGDLDNASKDLENSMKYFQNHDEVSEGYKLIGLAYESRGNSNMSSKYFKLSALEQEKKGELLMAKSKEADQVRIAVHKHEKKMMQEAIDYINQRDFFIGLSCFLVLIIIIIGYKRWKKKESTFISELRSVLSEKLS